MEKDSMNKFNNCLSCQSLRGEITLSPGGIIYKGKYWQAEHVYPTTIKGWLVMVLRRHIEALHELSFEEWREFALIQEKLIRILHQFVHCQKEYLACFAEQAGFQHIHFHIIPRSDSLNHEVRGSRVFSLLKIDYDQAIPTKDIEILCDTMRASLKQ